MQFLLFTCFEKIIKNEIKMIDTTKGTISYDTEVFN